MARDRKMDRVEILTPSGQLVPCEKGLGGGAASAMLPPDIRPASAPAQNPPPTTPTAKGTK